MAQPIPDDNCPLDDYLKGMVPYVHHSRPSRLTLQADTELDIVPGGLPEFFQTHDPTYDYSQWVPAFIRTFLHVSFQRPLLNSCYSYFQLSFMNSHYKCNVADCAPQSLESTLSAPPNRLSNRQFAERFKYIIISSSLLSSVLSTSPRSSFSAPGSIGFTQTDDETAGTPVTIIALWLLTFISLAFASGHFFAAFAALLFLKYSSTFVPSLDSPKTPQTGTTLQTLQHLVESSSSWESLVGEAMDLLRRDESRYAASRTIQSFFFDRCIRN